MSPLKQRLALQAYAANEAHLTADALIEQERQQRIKALVRELDERYTYLRDLLLKTVQGHDVADWELEMAERDIHSVLGVMLRPDSETVLTY